jgi:hypothetical protein
MKMSPKATGALYMKSIKQEKRIVELEELQKANAELEKELSNAQTMSDKEQSIRDLEQRANGIRDVRKANVRKKRTLGSVWGGGHIIHNMQLAEEELRNQVKALKEGN